MRKIIIDLDTMEITNTGPLSIKDAANAGINVTLNAVIKQAIKHGWESGENALIETCDLMWRVFREERDAQEESCRE